MRILIFIVALLAGFESSWAQSEGVLQVRDELSIFLQKQQVAGHLPKAFLNHQPLSALDAQLQLKTLDSTRSALSFEARGALDYFLGKAQKTKAQTGFGVSGQELYTLSGKGFKINVSPLAYLSGGAGVFSGDGLENKLIWRRTVGAKASGQIGKGVFFESRITGNVEQVPFPVFDKYSAPRRSSVVAQSFLGRDDNYDYLEATGLVGYRSPHIEVRAGKDRNHWGEGLNSLFISNYAAAYDQVQIRTTLGPVQYVNLFAAFDNIEDKQNAGDGIFPRRFGTFHELSIRTPWNLEVSLFESVIFARPIQNGRERYNYDLTYFNPIIFYRAVERDRGSPDNALVGGQMVWRPKRGYKFYGQFLLDEFTASELLSNTGYWGNKYAWLVGVSTTKIPKTFLTLEYVAAQPFLYTHSAVESAYLHRRDVIGFYLGPNAELVTLQAETQFLPKLVGNLTLLYGRKGENTETRNMGADPSISYNTPIPTREDYGNTRLQGYLNQSFLLESRLSYRVWSGLWADAGLKFERIQHDKKGNSQYAIPFAQVRWNLPFVYEKY